jgi:hypothetical protein
MQDTPERLVAVWPLRITTWLIEHWLCSVRRVNPGIASVRADSVGRVAESDVRLIAPHGLRCWFFVCALRVSGPLAGVNGSLDIVNGSFDIVSAALEKLLHCRSSLLRKL